MKRLNAVLAQLNPKLRDTGTNVETARGILSRQAGADLFVFPELFLGGYHATSKRCAALCPSSGRIGNATG